MSRTAKYSRVVVKISGEAFCKENARGIDIEETTRIAREIHEASKLCEIAVVVGGGNLVRGQEVSRNGVTAATGDYMGMLATVINALALQDVLEDLGTPVRVLSAISIQSVAEPFIRRRAVRHLEKRRVTIFAGGTGNPHFTTDTAAALKAAEIKAQVILKATKVEGVYDADPVKNSKARRFATISYLDVINQRLRIMDTTAISMAMDMKIPIIVFDLKKRGNLLRAIRGENIGTKIEETKTLLAR